MDPSWEGFDDLDEEEEEKSYEEFTFGRDALIFLIDASEDMFVGDRQEYPFYVSAKCAQSTLSNKIISSDKDLIGIVLFGTEKQKNPSEFNNIYVFQDLARPGAEKILEVEELMKCDADEFKSKYGHSKKFSLSDALWTCGMLFTNCNQKLTHRRILLFTNEDHPHKDNNQFQQQTKSKAKDLHDMNIDICLMHIQKPDKTFDISRFYKDIIYFPENETECLPDASERFEELLTRVQMKDSMRREHLRFSLGEGIEIALNAYNLVQPARKPCPVKLAKSNNTELKRFSKTYLKDTGQILMPSDKIQFQEYGNRRIYLELEEVRGLSHFEEPGLLLMGFKPISSLKSNHHIRPAKFIYPDDKVINGSISLFFALLQQCVKRETVPICRLISAKNRPPKFVALIPQELKLDEHGVQITPPGFHVIFLPYLEDIRSLSLGPRHKPDERLVEKAKEIIKKLQFKYSPESFENPALQKHWRNIEALALNRDVAEEVIDYTMPQNDMMQGRAGNLIEEFKDLAFPDGMDNIIPRKRKQGLQQGGGGKRTQMDESYFSVDVKQEAEAGKLGQLKVGALKEFCKKHKIKCGTKKAEMIEAINEYLGLL